MAASWKPRKDRDDDGRVKFGSEAERWLSECVRHLILTQGGTVGARMDDVDFLVAWYTAWEPVNLHRYVQWVPTEDYKGKGFTRGRWLFLPERVKADLPQALHDARRQQAMDADAAAFPTLDDWLRADIAGTLRCAGETGGTHGWCLNEEARRNLEATAAARRRRWPRACRGCGKAFCGSTELKSCPACRAKRGKGRKKVAPAPAAPTVGDASASVRDAAAALANISRVAGDAIQSIEGPGR